MIATRSAIHLVRCCHGQMSLIAVSYSIIFINGLGLLNNVTTEWLILEVGGKLAIFTKGDGHTNTHREREKIERTRKIERKERKKEI